MALRPSTAQDFLRLWRSVLPPGYTTAIEAEAEGAGFDVPALQAAIWADVDANVNVSQQAYFLRAHSIQTGPVASSGAKAQTTLKVYRAAPVLGDLQVRGGQVFVAKATDSLGGELVLGRFLAVAAVPLPEGESGPIDVLVEAEFEGYAGNVWEETITSFELEGRLAVPSIITAPGEARRAVAANDPSADVFNLGLTGRPIRIVPVGALSTPDATVPRLIVGTYLASGETVIQFDPPLLEADVLAPVTIEVLEMADLGVTVEQPEPAIGGVVDTLTGIGAERGRDRPLNATDLEFAEQLVELPDVVSPSAIERIVKRRLQPYGIPWCLREASEFAGLMGFTWDWHPWDYGQACDCDEPALPLGLGPVWLSDGTVTRFFIVCVTATMVEPYGFAYDSSDVVGPYPSAWDLGIWDGVDVGFNAAVALLWDDVDKARMAGVGFAIVLDQAS
jgi:hypothetical protein